MNTLLSESLGDLRRHLVPACQYVFAAMAALALYRWVAYFLDLSGLPETAAPMVSTVRLVLVLYLAVASSVIQALFFASLGAAIARPMWKYKGWRDALTRFFMPWLIINLFLVTLMDIHARFIGGGVYDPALMLELLLMVVYAAALPLGAAVMYWGALRWQDLPQMTVPLTRFLQLTLLPFGLGLIQYILTGVRTQILEPTRPWVLGLYTVTDMPLIALDVLIFALVWRICILDATTPREIDDDPLDF